MQNGQTEAGPDVGSAASSSSSSPLQGMARLPDHFAATFQYSGEHNAGSSTFLSRTASNSADTCLSQETNPRRSPRKSQARYTGLSAAFAASDDDDDEDGQIKSGATSSRKRAKARTAQQDASEEGDLPSSTSPNKAKARKRIKRTRDDPNSAAGSIYAHLKGLPDLFAEHNDIMFCGINPGVKSSHSGHHFAHRSNHFYPSLHRAGITQERMKPEQDVEFPYLGPLSLGLTNLAGRPTAEGSELLPSELIAGVPILLEKIQKWKPKTVCFVGKGISEAFMKGLKQAGAVHNGSANRKRRVSESASPCKKTSGRMHDVKNEESESRLAAAPIKLEGKQESVRTVRTLLKASVPSSVLCAHPQIATVGEHIKPLNGAPPSKASASPKKQLYTKGNSKDDTGYGILPICVSHTKRHGDTLCLDDVTLFFVTPSSSARVTTHFLDDKARILSSLRVLAEHLQAASTVKHAGPATLSNEQGVFQDRRGGGIKMEEDVSVMNGTLEKQPVDDATTVIELEVVDLARFQVTTKVTPKDDDDDPFGDGVVVDL
ncbi:uncharacterized protein UTRI_05431 [Ustilago trichophora]|uniref:Uracil-DNA glycosylase-like domain-containing protein n=1 Tax=Ustilago trichophora TaxID=86804 RepID=A0A5C3EK23_9BASI|nr:uncharacterized protein UTRI_05431 [Ustilago trichophora]